MDFYRLDGKIPAACSMVEHAVWFETADRSVALTDTRLHTVSTVFLGIDSNMFGSGRPILFETMVFERADCEREEAPDRDALQERVTDFLGAMGIMRRYATWGDAEDGHAKVVAEVLRVEMEADRFLSAFANKEA